MSKKRRKKINELKILKEEITESTCNHEITLEEISCFWGGITLSHTCIFCNEEIKNEDIPEITFQTYYDEFGFPLPPEYNLEEINKIIDYIKTEKQNENLNIIEEIKNLNLENVLTKNNKTRKRQG